MSNLVSVIMPVYNGVLFVGEAIGSVLTQTLTDWELIVVDDGSTDATPQVLSEFTDPRISVIRQKNGGEGAARNTGLDAATGQYIAFLDADDLHLPNGLADMISYLESHRQFDVVYSDGVMCDQDKKPLICLSEIRPGMYEGNILEHLVLSNIITAPDCTAVRRSAIEALDLRFDPLLKYGVDWDFWTRLARFSQFGYMPVLTCTYRVHGSNMTSAAEPSQAEERSGRGPAEGDEYRLVSRAICRHAPRVLLQLADWPAGRQPRTAKSYHADAAVSSVAGGYPG